MASLQEKRRKKGSAFIIQFSLGGERRSLFLDVHYSRDEADGVKLVVEKCVDAIDSDAPLDRKTLAWLESMNDDLRARFVAAGLVEEEIDGSMTLDELFQAFIRDRERALKPKSVEMYRLTERIFFERVDSRTTVAEFRRADALKYAGDLTESKYSKATRSTCLTSVKVVFNWALDREIVSKNPFNRISGGGTTNKSREHYVTLEVFERLLDACQSPMDRVLLTLYRIAGLRSSEALLLTWEDVDFDTGRLTVHSPKTERIEGKGVRIVPIFPRLRQELTAYRKTLDAQEKDQRIIRCNRFYPYRSIKRAVKCANLPKYPRLVQNLRSSASIDIFAKYGEVAENAWLGHTLNTAQKHYLHVLESDYEKAINEP